MLFIFRYCLVITLIFALLSFYAFSNPHFEQVIPSSDLTKDQLKAIKGAQKPHWNSYNLHSYHKHPYFMFTASYEALYVCLKNGCAASVITSALNVEEDINQLFSTPAKNPQDEREKIAIAMAIFEYHIGKMTEVNTWGDRGGNSYRTEGSLYLDCISEAYNTLSYLLIIKEHLVFHKIVGWRHRALFFILPHNAIEIQSFSSKESFVVDTWVLNNAYPALIVPLEKWKNRQVEDEKREAIQRFQKLPEKIKDFLKVNRLIERGTPLR